nr:hypothetical protein [uncultured Sphingosinicella sp.]
MRLLLPAAALLTACGEMADREAAASGQHDGLWDVVEISGDPAPPGKFLIRLRSGRVTGGRDDCNSWGFDETRPPAPDGTRTILSDLRACGQTAQRRSYWRAIGNGNVVPRLTAGGELKLEAGGDEIVARRRPY